ncbi:MAG: acyl-CoA dehydrogenase [Deltaproteobacteria bacterium]|nr:acyl-CoA dehydrogenase [Deltaproteobacteria bacterium]
MRLPISAIEVMTQEQCDYLQAWQLRCYEAGLVGCDYPKAYGGGGHEGFQRIANHELSRARVPFLINIVGLSMAAPTILAHGSEEQKRKFIPGALSGEEIWCQGFSEPGSGSDLASLRARAEPDGEDFRIHGQKVWTTFGPWSNWIFVLARTDPDDRYGGISFFLMPLEQEGVEVRAIKQISGESEFGEVFFDGALAKREHLIGQIGEGWRIAMTVLGYERGATTLAYPAENDTYLADLISGVKENGDFERADVREKLARLVVENEVLRANGLRTLATLAAGQAPGPESSMEKILWSEYAQRQSDAALDLLGPQAQLQPRAPGARETFDWAYQFLWSRAGTIYSGSSEIQRNIIAKRVLGMPTK